MIDVIIKTHTVIGKGELLNIPQFVRENQYQNVGLVIDQVFKNDSYIEKLLNDLRKDLNVLIYYYDLPFEPDYDSLDKIKFQFKNKETLEAKVDMFIAIGGGSVIDFAKGVATLIHNHEEAITYKGFPQNLNPSIPVVAVPTTAGTASEVTFNAVFTDVKAGRKLGINTHNNFPVLAVLDSNMTKNCPYSVALSSGLDAMVHCFESFACKKSNYYTKMFAKEALRHLIENIEAALKEKDNDDAREKMLFGAYLAGISLYNSGSGPAGALSYPLGVVCKVSHGIGGGFILPYLIEHNVKNGYTGYAEIATHIGIIGENDTDKSNKLIKYIFDLYQRLEVWSFVKRYNVNINDATLIDYIGLLQGAFDQNPLRFTPADGIAILKKIFN